MNLSHKMKWINYFQKLFSKRQSMKYLYKYTPHNNESRKYKVITESQLWFSKIGSFNDPIDSKWDYIQQYTTDEIKKYWENFLKKKPHHTQTINEILQKLGK